MTFVVKKGKYRCIIDVHQHGRILLLCCCFVLFVASVLTSSIKQLSVPQSRLSSAVTFCMIDKLQCLSSLLGDAANTGCEIFCFHRNCAAFHHWHAAYDSVASELTHDRGRSWFIFGVQMLCRPASTGVYSRICLSDTGNRLV